MQNNVIRYAFGSERVQFGNVRYPRVGPCRSIRTERGVFRTLKYCKLSENRTRDPLKPATTHGEALIEIANVVRIS